MAKIIDLHTSREVEFTPDADLLLERAKEKLANVVVVGWTGEGDLYVDSSEDLGDMILLLEVAKQAVLKAAFES